MLNLHSHNGGLSGFGILIFMKPSLTWKIQIFWYHNKDQLLNWLFSQNPHYYACLAINMVYL